jgi:Aldehyde dehydrogenase family
VVGVITPWNGPLAGPIMDGIAALMAGAAVLVKPSEVTPLSWAAAARGWRDEMGGPAVLGNANGVARPSWRLRSSTTLRLLWLALRTIVPIFSGRTSNRRRFLPPRQQHISIARPAMVV